jgi:hypothetical protein
MVVIADIHKVSPTSFVASVQDARQKLKPGENESRNIVITIAK